MDHHKVPSGWAAWLLTLAATLPVALLIRFGWKVLTGSADESFGLQDRPLSGVDLLGTRWAALWVIPSVPILPVMTMLPLMLLVLLVLTQRPRALIPTRLARGASSLLAAVTAVLGVTGTLGVSAQLQGSLPGLGWGGYTGSQIEAWAPTAAVVFTTAVVSAIAAVILWPGRGTTPEAATVLDIPADAPVTAAPSAEDGVEDGAAEPVTGQATLSETVVIHPHPQPAGKRLDLPAPLAADLDLYRRR